MSNELLQAALNLPPAERAELVERLRLSLESADGEDSEEIDDELAEEIEARCAAYDRGEVEAMDAFEALDRIEKSLIESRKRTQ